VEDEDGRKSVIDEMKMWRKVAEMIGTTLEDVCAMDEHERNSLLFLLPSPDGSHKSVDVEQLLGEYDEKEVYDRATLYDDQNMDHSEKVNNDIGIELDKKMPHHYLVEKMQSWNYFELNDKMFLKDILEQVPSNKDCFKMIEENPRKYQLSKKKLSAGNFIGTKKEDITLQDISKFFSGVKYVKSQVVCTFDSEPDLIKVHPDRSVKNGFDLLKTKRKIQEDIPHKIDALGRTRASTSSYVGASSYTIHVDDSDDSPTSRRNQTQRKGETGVCPSCQSDFLVNEVVKHFAECKGAFHHVNDNKDEEKKKFCEVCDEWVPLASFKDHINRWSHIERM